MGGGLHGCIVIAIHLTNVFAKVVNFATDNFFLHTFAPSPHLDEILGTPLSTSTSPELEVEPGHPQISSASVQISQELKFTPRCLQSTCASK